MKDKIKSLYFILSLIVIILFYIIPYSIFHGFEIAIFWFVITLAWLIITNFLLLRGRI
ncbi:MAG: hypothetical protein NZ922_01915 [Candidatus Methanomethyliaceae archaeon]|nr:hypothetical protein [Candidatus Methanomethyliaceae archaeon]MDW7970773.1 hypothetical protein [Nitrososphaerota archaeon]